MVLGLQLIINHHLFNFSFEKNICILVEIK